MPEIRRTKAVLSRQQWKEMQKKRQEEVKRRLERLELNGSVSLDDKEAFAHFPRATMDQQDMFPHALASFYTFMMAGKVSKSADSYMQQVKMLMERFQLSLDAMVGQEFFDAVKATQENVKRNNLIGAGLKKFRDFVQERGAATPWEVKATSCDERFRLDFRRWAKREPAPTGRSLLTAHFGRKESRSANRVQKDEVGDDGKAKQTESMSKTAEPSAQSAQAQKRESEKDEKQEENAEAAEPKAKVQRRGKAPAAKARGKRKREAEADKMEKPASEASSPKERPKTSLGGGCKAFFGMKSPPPRVQAAAEETPEKTLPPKVSKPEMKAVKAATPDQEKELQIIRDSIQQAVRAHQYGKAKSLHSRLLQRCNEIGCAVPEPFKEKATPRKATAAAPKESKDSSNANQDEGEEETTDPISFAQGILKEKFPLRFPDSKMEEDDADIIPDNDRWHLSSRKKQTQNDEDEAEAEEEDPSAQELKKALSTIPDASYEDIDRFPSVAATFRQWLKDKKKFQDDDAENSVKVLHDLFAKDEKSLDAMAKVPYIKAVAKESIQAATIKLFAAFWAKMKNGPWCAIQRTERKAEVRVRTTHSVPDSWGVRVVQRARKEDLVILSAPDGKKHFAEASKVAEHPVLQSEEFKKERESKAALTQLERDRLVAERLAKEAAKIKKSERVAEKATKVKSNLAPLVKELMNGGGSEQSLLNVVLQQHVSCRGCGRMSSREAEKTLRGLEAGWSSYDDVPNATEEEVQQYPRVLATFYQQGFPYMNGVRRLMELYKKKAWDMATPDFQRLVRMDPENAICNGYLNSAILYLRKFRESGGFDNLLDISDMDPVKLQSTFTPDFDREKGKEQENFEDLQVDVPLELVMADATAKWRSELQEKLDDDGYLLEDVDARGQRPVALSVALLPNATDEEWVLWPRILDKYEAFCKGESEEEKPIKREAEANGMFLAMKDLLEEHGKSPDAMASSKYLKMVKNIYGTGSGTYKDRAAALAKFADFWAAHQNDEFPEPKVHAMAAMKYKLIDRQLLEQAKKMAAEWKLPEGWAVKLGKDGRLIKVNGPGKAEIYHTKEAAVKAAEAKAQKKVEEAKAAHQQMLSAQGGNGEAIRNKALLRKQLSEAIQKEDYELAERLHAKLKRAPDSSSRKGEMPIVARSVKDIVRGKGRGKGGGKGVRKHALKLKAVKAAETPKKARKALGLKFEQKQQVARSELTLRAGEWRLEGIRLQNGSIVPLESKELEDARDAMLVLVYVDEEVRERKRRRIIEDWGLDDTWTVTVRYRLSGDQVTARRADGRVFFTKFEVACAKDKEAIEQIRPAAEKRAKEVEALLSWCKTGQLWEFQVEELPAISGLYRWEEHSQCYSKVQCLDDSQSIQVRQKEGGSEWQFFDGDKKLLAESTLESPFVNQKLKVAEELLEARGETLADDTISNRIASQLAHCFGSCCRFCTRNRSARPRSETQSLTRSEESKGKVEEKVEKAARFDARLREFEERRSNAPRSLLEMTRCMLEKLKALQKTSSDMCDEHLPKPLLQKQVLRIGTMCSGTDAPVLVARALERALKPEGSQLAFDHVFSVEFDSKKQEFLKANFPECPLLFRDCTQMGRKRALEVLSKKPQPVPGNLDILVAGFSCKDLSMMNSYRKTLQEMGQSGSTLRGILDYVERYRPKLVLLENVYAIAKRNSIGFRQVELVLEGLKARGYAAGYRLMNSCDYFLPQIRHRIWMWAIRISETSPASIEESRVMRDKAHLATSQVESRYNDLLVALEEPCALHFEDYMLDDDHPRVRAHFQWMKSKERKAVLKKKRGAKQDWLEKYDSHRTRNDYQYDRPYTTVRDADFLQVLNEREKELVDLKCLDIMNEQGKDPRVVPMLWELSQSVERVPGVRVRRDRQNYATCILPGSGHLRLEHLERYGVPTAIDPCQYGKISGGSGAALALCGLCRHDTSFPVQLEPRSVAYLKGVCKVCGGRPLLGIRSFVILVSTMSGVMLALKHCIIPRIIDRHQFEEGFDTGKYYGFAAQVLYHCVLCTCFAATIWITSLDDTLYHLATLAEPAYCTIDVLLLLFTGTSFTHWQLKPLLVHHTISCACCHALMYGIPGSIYGKMLQLVFHFSSAICLGIANALQTPSLKLSVLQRLWMQVLSMMFWAVTRVGLVFILGVCVLIDATRSPSKTRMDASMLWHSSRHRWVLGIEKLALQGIFAEDMKDIDFPEKLLGDLAGNAFTTSVCAANLIAILCCSSVLV
eukprot:s1198_g7.t3